MSDFASLTDDEVDGIARCGRTPEVRDAAERELRERSRASFVDDELTHCSVPGCANLAPRWQGRRACRSCVRARRDEDI